MTNLLQQKVYIDYQVKNVIQIKNKYGFRMILTWEDGITQIVQRSGFSTKKIANDARDKTIVELHNGSFILEKTVYLKEYYIEWLEVVMKPRIKHSTYDVYKNIVYNHLIPFLGHLRMTDINRSHIIDFYNKTASKSHSVVKVAKTVVKTGLQYALNNKLISVDASKDVELPKQIKKNKYRTVEIKTDKTLTVDQVKTLIEASKKTPIYLEVMFASLMGLRKSEIRGLKYDDIDYVSRTIKIQRQLGRAANIDFDTLRKGTITKQEISVKTFSSNRELEIPDILLDAILERNKQYEKQKNRRINDTINPFRDLDYICCSTYGNPRSTGFIQQYWKNLLKSCTLPNIRFHDLRATYCTFLVKENFNLKAISKMMGHASEIISVDVYTDNYQIANGCLEQLEPFIEKVLPKKEKKIKAEEESYPINDFIEALLNQI